MINKSSFKKMSKNIFNKSKGVQGPRLMHPEREWAIGIISALIIFIVASSWSVASYLNYRDTTPVDKTKEADGNAIYRESIVKAALEEFSKREVTRKKLQEGRVVSEETEDGANVQSNASTTEEVVATTTIPVGESIDEVISEVDTVDTSIEPSDSEEVPLPSE